MQWYFGGRQFAHYHNSELLTYVVKIHQSLLIRKLGDADMQLQYNKITNLRLAIAKLDKVIIRPGETFSFCKLVGKPTRRKGYVMGMELSFGQARPGIGGGICQIANMLNWLVWHSPLQIVSRSVHSFDPFPDEGRVLPFGSGAAVFYNYIDYQFYNSTPNTYQLQLWMTDTQLLGALRCDTVPTLSYHIRQENHSFVQYQNQYYRTNEIWRDTIDKYTGNIVKQEKLVRNFARVTYLPESYNVMDQHTFEKMSKR
jgi:vancomycin resistance protein VanW